MPDSMTVQAVELFNRLCEWITSVNGSSEFENQKVKQNLSDDMLAEMLRDRRETIDAKIKKHEEKNKTSMDPFSGDPMAGEQVVGQSIEDQLAQLSKISDGTNRLVTRLQTKPKAGSEVFRLCNAAYDCIQAAQNAPNASSIKRAREAYRKAQGAAQRVLGVSDAEAKEAAKSFFG
ncbi:hypothetical protein Pan216_16140 [Planctomycetes bacterium Pan216]|uniref:Uncharacterized protein n=1 Tax=Kolteria novifilia TaxID=2527975 RepID=A0A518B1A7_9BACT|nr:hypothetical protein Pan216_16140 [Planctomycetes bacterium Pan216]